jgi:hypothetical protein
MSPSGHSRPKRAADAMSGLAAIATEMRTSLRKEAANYGSSFFGLR